MKKNLTPKASAYFGYLMVAGFGCLGAAIIALAITAGFGLGVPSEFLACSLVAGTVFTVLAVAVDTFWA